MIPDQSPSMNPQNCYTQLPVAVRLMRLAIGLVIFSLLAGFFMSGYSPPGVAGEVLRHNQEHRIDASPLFYTEAERMSELEAAIHLRRALRKR